ncbi:MAG TPA: hypothetical protein VEA41_01870 [Salinarimonas sp.]|nr:hypothetical protein [Salinarimonas sp.]
MALANLAFAMDALAARLSEAARVLDTLEGAHRERFLAEIAVHVREIADYGHESARVIERLNDE